MKNLIINIGDKIYHILLKQILIVVADEEMPAYSGNELANNEISLSHSIAEIQSYNAVRQTTIKEFFDLFEEKYIKHPENRAMTEHGDCKFRTDDGRKCMIGNYIPDELYDLSVEQKRIVELLSEGYLNSLISINENLLNAMQGLHDKKFAYWMKDLSLNLEFSDDGFKEFELLKTKYGYYETN